MSNPNGPYPGRQLFIGTTVDGYPSLAYLVTGRNPQSRERITVPVDNSIRIGPVGAVQYDPLRHYTAIKYENSTGIAVVSNGIQTEAIFETYQLLFNTESLPTEDYMEKLLDGAGAEPDHYHTPRIAGVITGRNDGTALVYIVAIKTNNRPAKAFNIEPESGMMMGVSTYKGALDDPEAFDIDSDLPRLECKVKTAQELAEYLFDLSYASYQGDDIRVCAIGGIRSKQNRDWNLAIVNKHQRQG